MATKQQFVTHLFGGGWATDFGVTAPVELRDVVEIPYLIDAENVLYELDGGPHKMPGTAKLNSSALESGAAIKGIFDYWDTGTGATSTQHRVIHIGTKIKKDDADGTFTDLFTGMESGKVPHYSVLEDVLIMASDSTTDVPKSWDGTTAQNLAGSPPNFAFSTTHQNRSWAAGVVTNSSRLYYSALLDPEDWTGAGSGSIDIDPRDGDRITAIASFRNELFVFKGPYKGSIHRITGSAPTGDDAFARKVFAKGVGAVGQNTVFPFANDLGFMWSDGTVRSLIATDTFGDLAEASLSRPINREYLDARVNLGRLKDAWAAVDDVMGIAVFALPIDASSDPNTVLAMDFRFSPPRWSWLPDLTPVSIASVVDAANNNRRIIMLGGSDGFVRKWNEKTRTNDGSGIAFKVTTPHFNYGRPANMKTIGAASIGLSPKGSGSVTFGWQRDNFSQQTETVTQGGGTGVLDSFVLGTDTLGGARFVDRFMELHEGGEFRSVRYQVSHATDSEDLEIHNIGAMLDIHDISWENTP